MENCVVWARGPGRAATQLADYVERGAGQTVREIMHIALHELRAQPSESPIEGSVRAQPGTWWRRCVRRAQTTRDVQADLEESDDDADQYVLIYRQGEPVDEIEKRHPDQECLRILYVLHNSQLASVYRTLLADPA